MYIINQGYLIGVLLIYFFLGIGFMLFNMWLAEVARKAWGQYIKWFIAFHLLPIISHLYFLFLYQTYLRNIKRNRAERLKERQQEREASQSKPTLNIPLTPFEMPEVGEKPRIITIPKLLIPDKYRDSKVENLIAWGELPIAYDLIESKLARFREKGDTAQVEVYSHYLDFVRRRLGLP